jgi:D-xylulose reductase
MSGGWGADVLFEASGHPEVFDGLFEVIRPGGRAVLVGMPPEPVGLDVVAAQIKEIHIEHIFRYAHVYPRAVALMGSGKLDVRPLVTDTFRFDRAVEAFDFAAGIPARSVKAQIVLEG